MDIAFDRGYGSGADSVSTAYREGWGMAFFACVQRDG